MSELVGVTEAVHKKLYKSIYKCCYFLTQENLDGSKIKF